MGPLSGWDIAVLVAAAYVAVMLLVRLMRQRQGELIRSWQQQVALEQQRRKKQRQIERQRALQAEALKRKAQQGVDDAPAS